MTLIIKSTNNLPLSTSESSEDIDCGLITWKLSIEARSVSIPLLQNISQFVENKNKTSLALYWLFSHQSLKAAKGMDLFSKDSHVYHIPEKLGEGKFGIYAYTLIEVALLSSYIRHPIYDGCLTQNRWRVLWTLKRESTIQQAYGTLLIRHAHYRCPPTASRQLQLAFLRN